MGSKRQFQDWFEEQQDLGERCGVSLGWAQEELMEAAWNASRRELIEELRKLDWAPCVLQEAIDAAGVEPC
jgi:hypothetical protein